ncbi:GNAT family N-acetyltransferase [Rariglobus hedericola]|uniref:GNAT family N-acetyltransferase n=1 Tax=Rariglobus hedericola TaxID=2597822 RepID=A0A556QJN3_9BACT|nr:GNAT family protein [Rariglobus hedericola]TSJ76827.1 GNAT family N-acetyltransferase [Rariglobus hedericola]
MSAEPALLLLTDRPSLRLRTLREDDAAALFALVDRNRAHLRVWLPWIDANTAVGHSSAFIEAMRLGYAEDRCFACGLFFEGRLVGVAGAHLIDHANRTCQIGYWLDEAHCGRGLMTSAVRALTAHAFTTLQLNRVEIRAAPGNYASQAVCERLGFIREGVVRDAEWLYDHYVDLTVNSLLLREWQTAQVEDDAP